MIPALKMNTSNEIYETQIKKIAIARNSYALLMANGQVRIVDIHTGESWELRLFRKSIDIAAGFDHIIGLREDGSVVYASVKPQSQNEYEMNWHGGVSVSACEGHSAMVKTDGTAFCTDYSSGVIYPEVPKYNKDVSTWKNIKQIALTYEDPFALTYGGEFYSARQDINSYFNDCDDDIVQIDAFGAYYANHIVTALYSNGMTKACEVYEDKYRIIEDISEWRNLKKISCGNYAVVIGLTKDGEVLFPQNCKYKDRHGDEVKVLDNIIDIATNFEHLIALSRTGEVIYLSSR